MKTKSKTKPIKKSQKISPQQAEIFLPKTAKVSRKGLEPQLVTKRRNRKKNGTLTTTEIKLLESKYTRGIAAFGSEKNLQKSTNLKLRKNRKYLETKNAHTKHRKYQKKFPKLKVFAYDINEIWSLDLAHVDKLSEYNRGVSYLLVAVDCLSRYLRVEPLKSKYATTTAEAFKKMIKNKQPEKVWVDAGTEFKG